MMIRLDIPAGKGDIDGAYATFDAKEHWVDFKVYDQITVDPDGTPEFRSKADEQSFTPKLDEAEVWFEGNMKWDGCSHLYLRELDGGTHLCGPSRIVRFAQAVEAVYRECAKRLGGLHAKELAAEFDATPPVREEP
jgi:hypothetical protein